MPRTPMPGTHCMMAAALLTLAACAPTETTMELETHEAATVDGVDVEAKLARYAPTELSADLSGVPDSERIVLVELIKAARLMDEIFLRQASVGNPAVRDEIAGQGGALQTYFALNFGPWDRLDDHQPYYGETPHPEGAGYYPVDMSKEEFESWLAEHPEDSEAFKGLFSVVVRNGDGLAAVPYSEAYREWLEPAAEHLRNAAAATANDSLRRFLESRAAAFSSDDYYASDMDWMDLDAPVEVTIGPYETYEDGLFAYKAAFEGFVTINVPEESARLARFKEQLPWLERNLPIADEYKNFDRGTDSPIRVVDEIYVGGDSKSGVQTLAFNLPNDERVREAKGSKNVLLRNVLRAKYEKILVPIAERVLVREQIDGTSFDAFFAGTLQHELAHGLGPGNIVVDGRETEVRLELKELYGTLEEAKADVMGVYDIMALAEKDEVDPIVADTLHATYVAGLFRSARFGVHEAHGQGVVSQFNYLLEKGALEVDDEGRFRAVPELFAGAIESLLSEMLMLQARGDYAGTSDFLGKYGVATPELLKAIDRLADVPVDIRPIYSQAEELLAGAS